MPSSSYFEMSYQGPWKGVDVSMPEDMIDPASSPTASNWILRAGEIRSRPRRSQILPGLPDESQIVGHTAFVDSNNVTHMVVASTSGLWQLNSQWRMNPTIGNRVWANIAYYTGSNVGAPAILAQFQTFVNSVFYVN